MGKNKYPSVTYLVFTALVNSKDFMNHEDLMKVTGCNRNQISAACIHLRNRKAVDVIIDNGVGWWYATPETDNRSMTFDERVQEQPGNRHRKRRSEVSK